MRCLAKLGCVLLLLAAGSCGGDQCKCTQAGVTLTLPCAAARQRIKTVTGAGACIAARVDCAFEECASPEVHVVPDTAGQCEITVTLQDGTQQTFNAIITKTTGCCAGFYADANHRSQELVVPGACADGG
jgi:hypothetical protein